MQSKDLLDFSFDAPGATGSELAHAFSRFTEASERLTKRYEALRLETEDLRARLRDKDEEIKRNARLAMLGETAAAIAHEVRNPLGAIKLFISLLRDDMKGNDGALTLLSQMCKSVESLDNVVTNILQFSNPKQPSGMRAHLSPVHLSAIVHEQVERIKNTTRAETQFVIEWNAEPFIIGDEHILRSAIFNLLLNAVQALKKGGAVRVIAQEQAPETLRLTIEDSGKGIREEILPRLFEPFVTSKSEGTGLGLAVVKQVIEQHAGKIWVENCPERGIGARFVIELPRHSRGQ